MPEPALEALAESWRRAADEAAIDDDLPIDRPIDLSEADGPLGYSSVGYSSESPLARDEPRSRYADFLPTSDLVSPDPVGSHRTIYGSSTVPEIEGPPGYAGFNRATGEHRLTPRVSGYFSPSRQDDAFWAPVGSGPESEPSARAHYDEPTLFPEYREVARAYVDPGRHTGPAETGYHELEPARPEEHMSWAEPPRHGALALPQRVPGKPDVPPAPELERDAAGDLVPAEVPELSRIASYLRDEDEDGDPVRPDGFDIPAVLAAVRVVPGVREAQLRTNPTGLHTLRLELADDADPGLVSREVARLLKERMGLAAEPNDDMDAIDALLAADRRPIDRVSSALGAVPTSSASTSAPPRNAAVPSNPLSLLNPLSPRDPGPPPTAPTSAPGTLPRAPTSAPAFSSDPRPLPVVSAGARVVIEQTEVTVQGSEATVEVRLNVNGAPSYGVATGPAVDGYMLRLSAVATTHAIDELLAEPDGGSRGRCFVEHAAVVPFGSCEVAIVVLLLVCGSWVEQLAGSAMVGSDPRQAVVRATLSAVNRRMEALLP